MLATVPWSVVFAYAGDALWVIALTVMFAASRAAWSRTAGLARIRYLGAAAPRLALWVLPVGGFLVSLWPALQARTVSEEASFIVFGLRAITAPLLALLHLRGLRDTLQP